MLDLVQVEMSGHGSPFSVALRREWLRLSAFYQQRVRSLEQQLIHLQLLFQNTRAALPLLCKLEEPSSERSTLPVISPTDLADPCWLQAERESVLIDLYDAVLVLRKFVSLSFIGSVKIIKKHDKNLPLHPLGSILLPELYTQSFYSSRDLALIEVQLEVCSTHLLRLFSQSFVDVMDIA